MATLAQPQPTVAVPGESEPLNVVESPISPSSAFALSRFEFETDTKGNQGTKILMVEWDAAGAAVTAGSSITSVVENGGESEKGKPAKDDLSDWEVSWEGKDAATVLPIRDSDVKDATRRVYFLLPPGASIPTIVNISKKSGLVELRTKPMPAIFPEGLVSEEKGTRGVLHTLWAKKRLQELETEIADEMKDNGEGIGLEMALQERQWIVDHFGLSFDMSSAEAIPLPPNPGSPASPRSPIGGRLGEKLKGLKLATSPAEMAAAKEGKSSCRPWKTLHAGEIYRSRA